MKLKNLSLLLVISIITLSINCQDEEGSITIMPQDEVNENDKDYHKNLQEENAINTDTSISHEELDSDGYSTLDNQKELNTNFTQVEVRPQNLPEAQVILPIRRRDTSKAVLNVSPCGGIPKLKADTLTNRGSNVHVIWETITPVSGGNCTVKLSPGLEIEKNFTVLKPIDAELNKEGNFPCGRVKGFEAHEFALPEDYVCDQCTLQWTWITPVGNFYSCSDIIINGNKIEDCLARCKNGGACFNGKCLCNNDYFGEFCQNFSKKLIYNY
jgi:hypothetical protein